MEQSAKKTILLADDDVQLVSVISDLLEAQGYAVLKAFEGVEAFDRAKKEKPDLIILDWKMPAGKGSAVLEMLYEKEETSLIPVIVLTGASEPGMKEIIDKWGVKAFLTKPYEVSILLKTIREVLGESSIQ